MKSNDEKALELYSILSGYHQNVLTSAGLTTPTFERLRQDPDFETRIYRFAQENLYVIDALSQKKDVVSEQDLEHSFTYVQDMTNKYLRDVLPPEYEDDSADGDLSHPFWEKRWLYINTLITTGIQ